MIFTFTFLFMLNCFSGMNQSIKNYTLELDIQTSFQGSKKWIIQRYQAYCILDSLAYKFEEKDSLLVHYFQQLDTILSKYKFCKSSSYSYKDGKHTMWTDGTMTYGKLIFPDTIKTFNFHSGNIDSDTKQIELIDVFFNLTYYLYNQKDFKKNLETSNSDYLAKIENQVGRTPIRQVTVYPLHYRLYDRVYPFNYLVTRQLFENMPLDRPILIDVGNYANITGEFESFLKEFFKTRSNIYWIIPNKKEKMISMGLKKEYILDSFTEFNKIERSIGYNK